MKKYILSLCVGLVIILPTIILAQVWEVRYNGPGNGSDYASAIVLDNSGNIYVTGWSYGSATDLDYATVKYDSSGVEQWVARYNGDSLDRAYAIALDNSANIYITGTSWGGSSTKNDYVTVKYNSSGVEGWVARYNGPGNDEDIAWAIALDNSGNVYVTGESWGSGTDVDCATVKYDSSGVEQWVTRYNGPVNGHDQAFAIALDNSGNIYVTGPSEGLGTSLDYATVKYDSSGVEQWVARYNNDPDNDYDFASAIGLDDSGNIYVTGYSMGSVTYFDYATVKYDSSGVEKWVKRYDGPGNDYDVASAIALDNSGNFYVTGGSEGSGTDLDYATIKYLCVGVEEEVGSKKQETRLEIYQNPSRDKVDIRWQITENIERNLIIYNATGRLIKEFHITDHSFNRVTWDGRDNSGKKVPSGIYFLKFQSGSYIETKKIILFR